VRDPELCFHCDWQVQARVSGLPDTLGRLNPMKRIFSCASLAAAVFVAACGGSSVPSVPQNVSVTPGDGRVVVTFTQESQNTYWVFSAPGSTVSFPGSTSTAGYKSVRGANSPHPVIDLVNGTQYAFIMAASEDGSKVGDTSPVLTATPRPAGATWTAGTSLGAISVNAVVFDGTNFVAVGAGGAIFTSTDAIAWTAATSGTTSDLNGIAFVNSRYVAVGANGTVLSSSDRVSWGVQGSGTTETLYGIGQSGGTLIATGTNGTVLTSSDSTVWNRATTGVNGTLYAATGLNGRAVVTGAGGTLLTSTDLSNWQAVPSGASADLRGVTVDTTKFVVVGAGGAILSSADGLSWTSVASGTTASLAAVTFASQFVAVGASGTVLTSLDGTTWLKPASGTTSSLNGVFFGLGRYSAVGTSGTNLTAF
jgi:hypothetical protein